MKPYSVSDNLPTDMILEILLNLPVKSLLRFKSVCKSWNALFSGNNFITMHVDRSRRRNCQKEAIVIKRFVGSNKRSESKTSFSMISNVDSSTRIPDLSLGFVGKSCDSDLQFIFHCDGLILDVNYELNYSIVCNLATRETVLLPIGCSSDRYVTYALGFGYNLRNHRYEVIRISSRAPLDVQRTTGYDFYHTCPKVEVYTLGTCSWRQVKKCKFNSIDYGVIGKDESFYFNGSVHWRYGSYHKTHYILSFDLGNEEFREIQLPEDFASCFYLFDNFLAWNGNLAVSVNRWSNGFSHMDIYVMKEYGVPESWTKVFRIEEPFRVRPLTIWENNEVILEMDDKLVCYNISKQEFKTLVHGGKRNFRAFVYMESLVPVKRLETSRFLMFRPKINLGYKLMPQSVIKPFFNQMVFSY